MREPEQPETLLLDFQRETAPVLYLADMLYDDLETPEIARVLCEASFSVHEKAVQALLDRGAQT